MSNKISLVIPTLNEPGICERLDMLMSYIRNSFQDHEFEIVIVDDSVDETFKLVEGYKRNVNDHEIVVIKGDNKGLGGAVKKGALTASGQIVFYIDSDLTIPLENIRRFVDLIEKDNYDIVIAERRLRRHLNNPMRLVLSFLLVLVVRIFFFHSLHFSDTVCVFKAFKRDVIQKLARAQSINSGIFDLEYLYIASLNNKRIASVQVKSLPEIRKTRIGLFGSAICVPVEILRMKANKVMGRYTSA